MKTLDIMKRAGRNLRQAKGRTILTSLAIAIGAFTLTLSLAIGEGARQYADELLKSNIDPQTVFVVKDESLVGGGGGAPGLSSNLREYGSSTTQFGGATFKALNADDITTIENAPGVESVTPTYLVNAQYLQVEGVDKKFTTDITVYDSTVKAEAAAGSLPELGQQIADDEIVMPESFVEVLKPGATASDFVGKTITLRLVRLTQQPSDAEIEAAFASGGQQAVQELFEQEVRDEDQKRVWAERRVEQDKARAEQQSRRDSVQKARQAERDAELDKEGEQRQEREKQRGEALEKDLEKLLALSQELGSLSEQENFPPKKA